MFLILNAQLNAFSSCRSQLIFQTVDVKSCLAASALPPNLTEGAVSLVTVTQFSRHWWDVKTFKSIRNKTLQFPLLFT